MRISFPRILAKATERLSTEIQNQLWNFSKSLNKELVNKNTRIRFFESLRKEVEGLKLTSADSHWTDYYEKTDQNRFKTKFSPQEWGPKEQSFLKVMKDLRPKTVLDLGCNTGHYARLAAENGARVIACDSDSGTIDRCYKDIDKENLDILPLVVSAFNPAPAYGRGGIGYPSATKRFQSELVLALALIHHVVANQRLDIERIISLCKSFSTQWLLIEFVPPLDLKAGASSIPFLDDYTFETLRTGVLKRFKSVLLYDSFPKDRKLLLCEQ
jgi:SAM-dependent methyltransferase